MHRPKETPSGEANGFGRATIANKCLTDSAFLLSLRGNNGSINCNRSGTNATASSRSSGVAGIGVFFPSAEEKSIVNNFEPIQNGLGDGLFQSNWKSIFPFPAPFHISFLCILLSALLLFCSVLLLLFTSRWTQTAILIAPARCSMVARLQVTSRGRAGSISSFEIYFFILMVRRSANQLRIQPMTINLI